MAALYDLQMTFQVEGKMDGWDGHKDGRKIQRSNIYWEIELITSWTKTGCLFFVVPQLL